MWIRWEEMMIRTKIVQIGNSRGVRLPKALIEQAGLTEEIELVAQDGEIVISSAGRPRRGWAEAAQSAAGHGEGVLLDPYIPNRFDAEEWEW